MNTDGFNTDVQVLVDDHVEAAGSEFTTTNTRCLTDRGGLAGLSVLAILGDLASRAGLAALGVLGVRGGVAVLAGLTGRAGLTG